MKTIKARISIDGGDVDVEVNSMKQLSIELVNKVLKNEMARTGTKTAAVENTAVLLNITERTVWNYLNKRVEDYPTSKDS